MAIVSKPLAIGLGAVVVLALVYVLQPDDSSTVTTAKPKTAKKDSKTDKASAPDFLPEDFVMRFDRAKPPKRNIFKSPGLEKKTEVSQAVLDHVPSNLADGDGNWIFTGVVVLDDKKMALLENPSTHQGSYVGEGEAWKTSKLVRISSDGVAFAPKTGGDEAVVFRHKSALVADANPSPPGGQTLPPANQIQPMNPQQLSGPIGGGMVIRRRRGNVITFGGG